MKFRNLDHKNENQQITLFLVHSKPPTCFGPLSRNFQMHNEQHKKVTIAYANKSVKHTKI